MTQPKNEHPALAQEDAQRDAMWAIRASFFNELLHEWSRPPETIDDVMGQSEAFLMPDFASSRKNDPDTIMIKDVPRGLLAVSVTPPTQYGLQLRWVYSFLQAGDWIRLGVLVQGDPKYIVQFQSHHDQLLSMERVWDRMHDYQFRDEGGLLFEWRFSEPDFYNNYIYRDRFKIMARHFHFRLGKIMAPLLESDDLSDRSGQED